MPNTGLIKVGDRIFDLNAVTHASFTAQEGFEYKDRAQLALSFGCDDCVIFYETEAEQLWAVLCDRAVDILPGQDEAA